MENDGYWWDRTLCLGHWIETGGKGLGLVLLMHRCYLGRFEHVNMSFKSSLQGLPAGETHWADLPLVYKFWVLRWQTKGDDRKSWDLCHQCLSWATSSGFWGWRHFPSFYLLFLQKTNKMPGVTYWDFLHRPSATGVNFSFHTSLLHTKESISLIQLYL